MRLIGCATSEVVYTGGTSGSRPRGWVACAKYFSVTEGAPVFSLGTGITRDEALDDLVTWIKQNGIEEPSLNEARDYVRRAYLLQQASRLADFYGFPFECI